MGKCRKMVKRVVRPTAFLLALVLVVLSNTTVYAAGTESLEEMYISAESSQDVNIVYINEDVMPLGNGYIDWEVPVGTRYVTALIYMSKGTQVEIGCIASPIDNTYWYGIMNPDDSANVVETTGSSSHTFTTTSSGYHRIMVENRGSSVLTVAGGYSY